MRVIIAGAGKIGWYLAEHVSAQQHDVTLIESSEEISREAARELDVRTICGAAASAQTLLDAGADQADLVAALTENDEGNLVCASVARWLGARQVVARVDAALYRSAAQLSYATHFGIDYLLSPERLVALQLASMVRNPGCLAVEHFAQAALEMQQFRADGAAANVGKPLATVKLSAVRVGSIKRGDELIIPKGADCVEDGDLITLVGATESVGPARATFESETPKKQKVLILGGGRTTASLMGRLRGKVHRVTIIERCEARCNQLAEMFPDATILHGDGTDLELLKEERVQEFDYFVATRASDEANIMAALQAKHFGVPTVLVVMHRPDYAEVAPRVGVNYAVSPRVETAGEILRVLNKTDADSLALIDQGNAEILDLTVKTESFIGVPLRSLLLPPGCLVLALQREKEILMPNAETVFQKGDEVLVIALAAGKKQVIRAICG